MANNSPFVILSISCDKAVIWAIEKLELAGLQSIRTFDLQAARLAHSDCPCPHHGTEQCSCQMIVLLIYHANTSPVTMVIHGSEETSWFYLINTLQQPVSHQQEKSIQDVLRLELDVRA